MERIVISDTNIFIDLWTMRLLGEFFMPPFEIHTVDMVLAEREIEVPDLQTPLKFIPDYISTHFRNGNK